MMNEDPAEDRLAGFMARYNPEIEDLASSVLDKMRTLLPGAVEMVYDNYNALVIGFGPTERPSEAILSIVLYPRYVSVCFLQGVRLPDPHGLLQGSGNQVRHIRLESAETLDKPAVRTLISDAVDGAKQFGDGAARRLIIKSISAKQRPRRPP